MDALEMLKQAAAERGDYTQDGLIYCGNCKTPKEFDLNGVIRPIMCECIKAEREAREKELDERIRIQAWEDRVKSSGIEKKFIKSEWGDIVENAGNSEALKQVRHYIDNFERFYHEGRGLLLYGGVGTGKTMIASIIGSELMRKGASVLFISVIDLMNRGTGFEYQEENERFNRRVKSCGLLIIDDLGAERSTSFAKERVMAVLNARYLANLPMVVTTNLSMQELCGSKDIENDRIIDRCIEVCYGVEFKGGSYRRTIAKMNRNEFK